ncbi:hypothetical protein [Rufibacter radiotolerans]|uniref:hypothetical protein n=1 Tax=Rufibacter radiotolerans TaxID=1379910 RepID=UPI000A8E4D48|nr:hypothetical protein [Rufibacter radiotolerans]
MVSFLLLGVLAGACTSSRDNAALEPTEPQRTYSTMPTVRDMNEQSSDVNRKKNIEDRNPNAPANQTPAMRSQKILPGRQPAVPDTIRRPALPPRPDTTRRRRN